MTEKTTQKEINVSSGAKVETVNVKPVAGKPAHDGIQVVTTAPGTLSALGIVPVGTELSVDGDQYSAAWMRPVGAKAQKAVDALMRARTKKG